jgi:hypothetical protein
MRERRRGRVVVDRAADLALAPEPLEPPRRRRGGAAPRDPPEPRGHQGAGDGRAFVARGALRPEARFSRRSLASGVRRRRRPEASRVLVLKETSRALLLSFGSPRKDALFGHALAFAPRWLSPRGTDSVRQAGAGKVGGLVVGRERSRNCG